VCKPGAFLCATVSGWRQEGGLRNVVPEGIPGAGPSLASRRTGEEGLFKAAEFFYGEDKRDGQGDERAEKRERACEAET